MPEPQGTFLEDFEKPPHERRPESVGATSAPPAEDKVKVSEVLAAKKASRKPMSKEELVKKSLENPEVLASTMAALGMSKGQIAGTIGKKFPTLSKDDLNALVNAAFSANEDDAAGEE